MGLVVDRLRGRYRQHSCATGDKKQRSICDRCTALINGTFGLYHLVKPEYLGDGRVKTTKHFEKVTELAVSAKTCPQCAFMFRHIPVGTDNSLTIKQDSEHTPVVWSAQISNASKVYFVPTKAGAFLQPGIPCHWAEKRSIYSPDADFGLVKKWLEKCQEHTACQDHRREASSAELPTRLIDVGLDRDKSGRYGDPRLVIGILEPTPYVALSYCWGGKQPLILTTDSLTPFQNRISWKDIPTLFRDCITVCRALNIQYLWIDAVCIVQPESDGGNDFNIECNKMQGIYSRSTFTISATAGLSPSDGLFAWRSDQILGPVKPAALSDYKGIGAFSVARSYCNYSEGLSHDERWKSNIDNMPISSRCWTLQERFLPCSVLHFYEGRACWKCQTDLLEDGMDSQIEVPDAENENANLIGRLRYFLPELLKFVRSGIVLTDRERDSDRGWFKRTKPAPAGRMDGWYQIVDSYQQRGITNSADRLPAIGGLAKHFTKLRRTDYVAGLWVHDILYGLLWFRSSDDPVPSVNVKAPSWTWAHLNGRTKHVNGTIFPLDHGLSLKGVDVEAPHGSFAEVKKGSIRIRGFLRPVHCDSSVTGDIALPGLINAGADGPMLRFKFDQVADHSKERLHVLLVAGTFFQPREGIIDLVGRPLPTYCTAYFLVLSEIDRNLALYERVGLAWFIKSIPKRPPNMTTKTAKLVLDNALKSTYEQGGEETALRAPQKPEASGMVGASFSAPLQDGPLSTNSHWFWQDITII